jgi:hypothetical protein
MTQLTEMKIKEVRGMESDPESSNLIYNLKAFSFPYFNLSELPST